jgi:hypothetical protein
MRRELIVSAALTAAACAPATTTTPPATTTAAAPVAAKSAAELADVAGTSTETAVAVPKDAPNEGIDFQKNWIYDRYGRFRVDKWGIAHAPVNGIERRYKVLTVELADHTFRTVYFDITENWNAWQPPPAPK